MTIAILLVIVGFLIVGAALILPRFLKGEGGGLFPTKEQARILADAPPVGDPNEGWADRWFGSEDEE